MPTRIRAFLIHLAASGVIACLAIALVFLVWYPSPLATATGVKAIFLMMLGVDVMIGPLLTLIVYKPGKKSLRMDMTIIIVLQLAALIYGLWTMAQARPAWIVFNNDRFDIGQSNELDRRFVADARSEYRDVSWTGPRGVASVAPTDSNQYRDLLMESMKGGPDLPQRIDLYRPLPEAADAIRAKALPLSDLDKYNPPANVAKLLKQYPDADAFLPLMAKVQPMTVLVRKSDSKVIAIVDLNPWP